MSEEKKDKGSITKRIAKKLGGAMKKGGVSGVRQSAFRPFGSTTPPMRSTQPVRKKKRKKYRKVVKYYYK